MEAEGKKGNLRGEEKELDDKLMELGLLEPGMTLQEKRELASVVLESTRMAEEQMSQRSAEEKWESLLTDPKSTGSNDTTPGSESPELIAISVSNAESERPSTSSAGNQKRRDEKSQVQRETTMKGRSQAERDVRGRRGKRERDEDAAVKTIVLDVEEGEGNEGKLVETKKDGSNRIWQFTRRNVADENGKRECEVERPQKKLLGAEEVKERKGRREIKEIRGEWEEEKERRGAEEKRGKKEVEAPQDGGQKGDSLVVASSDEQIMEANKPAVGFYGPSCSSNAKELNPLRSELHGYSRKRRPPRSSQVSLLQLAKEDAPQRKKLLNDKEIEELILDEENSHEKSGCDETSVKSLADNKPGAEARDEEARRLFLEKHMRGSKAAQEKVEEGKGGDGIMDDDNDWETHHGGKIRIKESRRRNGIGGGPSGLRERALRSLRGSSERTLSLLAESGKTKRREQDTEAEIEDGSEVDDEKGGEEPQASNQSLLSDFILEGKKKRRLAKGAPSKKWVDVVIFPNSTSSSASDGLVKEVTKSNKKIVLPPNKRWRRVKRKVKSSFGSGSEVDEWISSEEEQKSQGIALSKEQLIARFDEQLNRLKDALKEEHLKKASSRSKYSRCKLCEKKCSMKVPPGFQEPDSDDDWNLWKICFYKPHPDSSDENQHSKKERMKTDASPLMRSAVTRSQAKQIECSPHSSSKSPVSFEDNTSNSPPENATETMGKVPALDIARHDDNVSQNKSPLLGEVVLFDKVIHSQPCVTKGTQTTWEDDRNSCVSDSQDGSVASGSKSKEGTQVVGPVWDLLEIDSEGEEVIRNPERIELSVGGREKIAEMSKNVTVRRGHNESPEYLPLRMVDEDSPSSNDNAAPPESIGRESASSLCQSVAVLSPIIPKGSRRGKLRAVEERKGGHSGKTNRMQPRGRKVDAHTTVDEESEEVLVLQSDPPESKEDNLPQAMACPLCNKEFPMSEIEAHASECNEEEEEELPRSVRTGGRNRQRESADASRVAGAGHQRFDVEEEEYEEMEDDEFEAASSSQEHAPRPVPLSTYVPISQQKDSLIDYSDQFPHRSGNVDLQSTLERMRQSLLTRVKKKTRWRKKKRPKWKRKKL